MSTTRNKRGGGKKPESIKKRANEKGRPYKSQNGLEDKKVTIELLSVRKLDF